VVKTDKDMGVSKFLGGAYAGSPKVYAHDQHFLLSDSDSRKQFFRDAK